MIAIYNQLLTQLGSDDATQRIKVLQVLAMVEETRALDDILAVFKTDPDSLVRRTAQWAGNLVWEAQQRGHSTESALNADHPPSSDTRLAVYDPALDYKEKRILDSLLVVPTTRERDMQNQQDLLRAEWERIDAIEKKRTTMAVPTMTEHAIADLDMLVAGLSEAFRHYLEEDT